MHEAGKGIDIMSRQNRMREYILVEKFHQERDAIRMDRITRRSADENMAEYDRLSTMKRGLHKCERNRLGRLKRILNK